MNIKRLAFVTALTILAISLASAQGYTFSTNLSLGATGQDVTSLQTWLISNGFHIPAIENGSAQKGKFGAQTKAAVIAYQKSVSLPSTGFVGPLTRGRLNGQPVASSAGSSAVACPLGYSCTPNSADSGSGAAASASGLPAGITTLGIPGIMSVTQGPLSNATINVGQTNVPIMTVRVQAQYSDLDFSGLVLDLGTDTSIYNKIFSKIYVYDGSNLLFSSPLNSTSVVQVSGQYVVGTAGYNDIIPKGTYRDITVKADLYPSIDSTYVNESPWYVSIDQGSVSTVDGAGIILYGPSSNGLIVQALTINKSLVDNATANISLDPTSPLVASNPVTDTTNNQYLGLPVLTFDVNAQNDTLHLHEVKVRFGSSGQGSITAAYLYQGSTQIMSASVSGGLADFNNIVDGTAGASIPVNTTVPFTVKVDVSSVTSDSSAFNVVSGLYSTTTTEIIAYNSIDSNATITGSAVGNQQTVTKSGPAFALTGTPTITKTVISTDTNGHATTSYAATFNVQVTAVGTNVALGLPASSTPAFIGSGFTNTATASTSIGVYKNGQQASLAGFYPNTTGDKAVTASYSQPTGTTVSSDGTYFTVSRNQTVTIPVTFTWLVRDAGSNSYAGQLDSINWYGLSSGGPSTFMQDQPSWRTPTSK